ncbi:uncharacterized protein LOC129738016 [Uranotaenia lowii]|uniref:uncharacterized protein LOC129738016 n=1 Tax=Uranotaenia lowii TaxID=190385 RepID=UPI00247A76C1|nr:uncharacterized protein LOC129738016 [Uranotaenia lowii]
MSALRKSASFRSKIPVRRERHSQTPTGTGTGDWGRRCASPQPSTSTIASGSFTGLNDDGPQKLMERKIRRRPWRYSSSSSFSSSDESHESEPPFQLLLKNHPATDLMASQASSSPDGRDGRTIGGRHQHQQQHLLLSSLSTDAISLDGLLDCVSSGSFSSPPSPGMTRRSRTETMVLAAEHQDHDEPDRFTKPGSSPSTSPGDQSAAVVGASSPVRMAACSYESLEHLNCALETLKISDTFRAEQRQQLLNQHYGNLVSPDAITAAVRGQQVDMKGKTVDLTLQQAGEETEDADQRKQRKLSDWYYIKSSPKQKRTKPPESPCVVRRKRALLITEHQHRSASSSVGLQAAKVKLQLPANNPHQFVLPKVQQQQSSQDDGQDLSVAKVLIASKYSDGSGGPLQRNYVDLPEFKSMGSKERQLPDNVNLTNSNKFPVPLSGKKPHRKDGHVVAARVDCHVGPPPIPARPDTNRHRKPNDGGEGGVISQNFQPHLSDCELSPPVGSRFFNLIKCTAQNVTSERRSISSENLFISDTGFDSIKISAEPQPNGYENVPAKAHLMHPNAYQQHLQFPEPYAIQDTGMLRTKNASKRPLPLTPTTGHCPPVSKSRLAETSGTKLPESLDSKQPIIDYGEEDDRKISSLTRCYPTKSIQQPQQGQQVTTPTSYRTDYELSGSYVSLECPSPPGPPACLLDNRRDPLARLARCMRALYTELALKEPALPTWVQPVAPGVLCPARLEPELRLHIHSHGLNECITVDQILAAVQTKDGPFIEAPRRVLIECPPWVTRSSLALRILHAWSREPSWPPRGQPVVLSLFVPLSELKGSIANYIAKELLPRGPQNPFASGFGGFSSAWNSLESLKSKLLIVLDGYDIVNKSRKNKTVLKDVTDLLEGRLFPEARVVLIGVTSSCVDLLPLMQRHITYEGISWGRSVSLLGGGQWGAPTRLIDGVQACRHLRNVARTSLGCLAISAIYGTSGGALPADEVDVIASVFNCVAANSSQSQITELGRLALFCLKTKRPIVSSDELKMYCSAPDSNIIGCLDRAPIFGRSARRKSEFHYTAICPDIAEFLAANYLVSLANRPGLLAAEVAGLAIGDEVEPEVLKVLTFAMSLLGNRAHMLLSKLTPLWLSPQTIFSLALAGGETESNLTALCELLGISKSPPVPPLEAKPIWVQIKSTPGEMQGWGLALKSPTCTLKNLELVYQIEKNMLLESRNVVDIFLDALSKNESVTTLRITSLIENEVRDSDINYLATCISKAIMKPRLESFELILTLLEEDPPILKLQSVVTGLCRSIPRQPKLNNLILDLGLCTSQLVQICSMLEKCPHVTRLSFPHLRCERGAVGALASLLNARPVSYLALASSWGARDDPPSSSGVSMGSGSGSSSGNSGLIKQSSLTGAPSPRTYSTGIFSSLPRGVLHSTSTMGRSATLPRQPMDGPPDKRSTDSVISRTWYPTPACDGGPHNSGTLHELLLAARDSFSRLHGLDLSKAQLSLEDSMCLGETVRVSTTLHSIKLEGASRLSEILPSVLGASESPSLQMLSLGSPRIALEDAAVGMSARALGSCITLRLLSLDGWSFRIENIGTLASVRGFLSLTSIRELSLNNCRLNISMFKSDITMPNRAYECRSIVNLKLAGAQMIFSDHVSMKGPHMLPYLTGFINVRELDLSAPPRTGLGSTTSTPLIISDKDITGFFSTLNAHFSNLNTLKICNWIIHLDDAPRTLKAVSKLFKSSPISHVKIDGIIVLDRPRKQRIEGLFMQVMLGSLPQLRWLGITVTGMTEEQINAVGTSCADMRGPEIDIRLCNSTIENARLMTHSLGLDGKFDIRVSTFGTSNSILIHIEKTSTKSSIRK